jgi:hypothetical protein
MKANSKPYDTAFKDLAEQDPGALLLLLGAIRPGASVKPLPREVAVQALLPDQPYEITEEGRTYIAHVEAQTRFEPDIPARVGDYGVYLWSRYRVPVYSYVLVLVPRGMPDAAPTRWAVEAGGVRVTVDYTIVRLWEVEAAQALAMKSESLLPFIPLMRGTRAELEQGARALGAVADEVRQRELALHFVVLGGLRYNRDEIFDLLGRITSRP